MYFHKALTHHISCTAHILPVFLSIAYLHILFFIYIYLHFDTDSTVWFSVKLHLVKMIYNIDKVLSTWISQLHLQVTLPRFYIQINC